MEHARVVVDSRIFRSYIAYYNPDPDPYPYPYYRTTNASKRSKNLSLINNHSMGLSLTGLTSEPSNNNNSNDNNLNKISNSKNNGNSRSCNDSPFEEKKKINDNQMVSVFAYGIILHSYSKMNFICIFFF